MCKRCKFAFSISPSSRKNSRQERQQADNVGALIFIWRASIFNVGPAYKQCWFNARHCLVKMHSGCEGDCSNQISQKVKKRDDVHSLEIKMSNDTCTGHSDSDPANTRRWTSGGLMLGHRLRRWTNIKPPLVQRLVFAWVFNLQQDSRSKTKSSTCLLFKWALRPTAFWLYRADCPANAVLWTNDGLMLAKRRRRWASINPLLVQCSAFAGWLSKSRTNMAQISHTAKSFSLQTSIPPV